MTAEPADWLTRHRHYLGRESNYTVQLDFRFDQTETGGPAPARFGVYGYWTQQERNYRLVVRPDAMQFSKRRPRLSGEITDNGHYVEYLLPAGAGKPFAAPLAVGNWYTAKFRLETQAGRTRLLAKVWPRDTREPTDWMLDQTDEGAAGDSKFPAFTAGRTGLTVSRAKMSFDNVLVSENQ